MLFPWHHDDLPRPEAREPVSWPGPFGGWLLPLSFVFPHSVRDPRTDVGPHSCPPGRCASRASCTSSGHWLLPVEEVGGRGASPPVLLPGVLGGLLVCLPAADHGPDSWAELDMGCTVSQMS